MNVFLGSLLPLLQLGNIGVTPPPQINATYVIVPIRCAVDPNQTVATNLAACGFDVDLYLQLKTQMGDR